VPEVVEGAKQGLRGEDQEEGGVHGNDLGWR